MFRLLSLSSIQCVFLVLTQVFLKITTEKVGPFSFSGKFFKELFTTYQFALSGICVATATGLWMYILKHFPFSQAYPMIGMSYVFGMLASIFIFHETIPATRWIGVGLIIVGLIFVARS